MTAQRPIVTSMLRRVSVMVAGFAVVAVASSLPGRAAVAAVKKGGAVVVVTTVVQQGLVEGGSCSPRGALASSSVDGLPLICAFGKTKKVLVWKHDTSLKRTKNTVAPCAKEVPTTNPLDGLVHLPPGPGACGGIDVAPSASSSTTAPSTTAPSASDAAPGTVPGHVQLGHSCLTAHLGFTGTTASGETLTCRKNPGGSPKNWWQP